MRSLSFFMSYLLFSAVAEASPMICQINRMTPLFKKIYQWRENGKDREFILKTNSVGERLAGIIHHQDDYLMVEIRELNTDKLYFEATFPKGFDEPSLTRFRLESPEHQWFLDCYRKESFF